jgi:hypothetical protein
MSPRGLPIQRVGQKRPCEICRHHTWCTYTDAVAFCMRVSQGSFRTARNGAFMHTSMAARQTNAGPNPAAFHSARAPNERLHKVYSSLLRTLTLSPKHRESLLRRGFDARAIEENLYASAPTEEQGRSVTVELDPLGLEGIPGFYRVGQCWRLVNMWPGILIKITSEKGQICGIQLRHDHYGSGRGKYVWLSSANRFRGTSSGAPVHWSKFELLLCSIEVLLTEGALKADLISYFLSVPVIAAAGVGLFGRDFGEKLKANFKDITAVICFDSDWRVKPPVKRALLDLQQQLCAARVPWKVRCWRLEYKGYDNYLLDVK